MFGVGLDGEGETAIFFPFGDLLDEQEVALEPGIADGADTGALEHGLGGPGEADAVMPGEGVLGLRDARDRADLPPDLRRGRGDIDGAGHGAELVRAGLEGFERAGHEGQERHGGDAEPLTAVGRDLGTDEAGDHAAEGGHE